MRAPRRFERAAAAAQFVLLVILLAGAMARVSHAATVLKDFTLIDGTDHVPVPHAAMIVDQGRVQWVGAVAALHVPAGAQVIDEAGKYVMPGLIDLHVHLGNTVDMVQNAKNFTRQSIEHELQVYAAYGVTTVQSLGTDSDLIFQVRAHPSAGAPPMARFYTVGQGVVFKGGYGGLAGVNQPVATPAEAVAVVDAQAAKGADLIKLWLDDELGTLPKMPPEISQAVIDAAHRHHLRAVAHVFYLEDARRLVAQGIDGLAHSVRDQPLDQALIAGMKAHHTWQLAATLSREASMTVYGSRAPYLDDPFFTRFVSATSLQILADPQRQHQTAGTANFSRYPQFLTTAERNTKRLYDAGIALGFGTDSGPPGRFPGYFAHWELKLLVDAGLTPAQAIRAATGDAARFLQAEDLGTLQAGKQADLIVLTADPTAHIENTRTIAAVYAAGRLVEPVRP